tara:strand:- start:480 stop:803 length:324 start_codon:yes stop_codon:yes gene_type:complete
MIKQLYHGTSKQNGLQILESGFDFKKSGSNWGNTYGKGIYFTPNYETAQFYAGKDGIVISRQLEIEAFYLKKDISPNSRKKIKVPNDINYNCIVNPSGDEYLILYFK